MAAPGRGSRSRLSGAQCRRPPTGSTPHLPSVPFQTTLYVPYPRRDAAATLMTSVTALSSTTGDPVHRFFQMWQQTGGDNANPDLYTWVSVTAGKGADTMDVTAT